MTKALIFSRTFPAFHPKAGEPTFFAEKIWNSIHAIGKVYTTNFYSVQTLNSKLDISSYWETINDEYGEFGEKYTTIRAGNNWKVGDMFSPRVWSGKPYNSKQITIAPDIRVEKVWNFTMTGMWLHINGRTLLDQHIQKLCKNDGLDFDDFLDLFDFPGIFSGQIICWNSAIEY